MSCQFYQFFQLTYSFEWKRHDTCQLLLQTISKELPFSQRSRKQKYVVVHSVKSIISNDMLHQLATSLFWLVKRLVCMYVFQFHCILGCQKIKLYNPFLHEAFLVHLTLGGRRLCPSISAEISTHYPMYQFCSNFRFSISEKYWYIRKKIILQFEYLENLGSW